MIISANEPILSTIKNYIQQHILQPRAVVVITIALSALILVPILYLNIGTILIYSPVKFDQNKLDQVIAYVNKTNLAVRSGVIALPSSLSSASIDGNAYVNSDKGVERIFIPAWVGRRTLLPLNNTDDRWVTGYLYTTSPININSETPCASVRAPKHDSYFERRNSSGNRQLTVFVSEQYSKYWYVASSTSE
jgi:hypothetical protein